MRNTAVLLIVSALCLSAPGPAAIIGRTVAAPPLTLSRLSLVPEAHRGEWVRYLQRSTARHIGDVAALRAERSKLTADAPPPPPQGGTSSMPLNRPADWYGTAQARRIADNIVSFETPAGGWGKNQDRSAPVRQPGQSFVIVDHLPAGVPVRAGSDESQWSFVGTIDNGATTTEMRFLARAQSASPGPSGAPYREAFVKGVRYLLDAQYPNGGWPQIYPLQGSYHDALTYNDDALASVVALLADVGARTGDYAFVPEAVATEARLSVDKAIAVILASQVIVGGKRTGWGQQHDPLTLAPAGARNFEPASLSSNESATLLRLLMRVPKPSAQVVAAVHDGVAWLEKAAIRDVEWTQPGPEGRRLIRKPGAGPLWSRFYDLKTMRPIFGDRDKTVHDDVNELSVERRNGYSWFGTGPSSAIKAYAKWAAVYPRS